MAIASSIDITAEQRETILSLLRRHLPQVTVWAYGSRVKWTSRPHSDLDLVAFATPEHSLQVGNLREAFDESNLPFQVSLLVWDEMPESFRKQVEAEYIVLVEGAAEARQPQMREKCAAQIAFTPCSNWLEYKFQELCDVTRGASPRPIHKWISPQGIPWIKIADASNTVSRTISETKETIRPEGRIKSVSVMPGDLILSNSATPGIPKFVGIEACIHDGWLLLRKFRNIDRLFCYYLLLYERPRIVRQGTGSVFTNLKTEILKGHKVRIPPIAEQRAIAHILGTLDDKIELNRRMNETLEAMARAIFKDWFVDFGPTRAKAEGRPPYLPAKFWDLFPDALDDEGKPVGWITKAASSLFEFNPRETLKKGSETPYLDMAALPTMGLVPDRPRLRKFNSGSKFRDGDTLFARITPCLENGKTAHVFGLGNAVVGTGSTEFIVIRSRKPLPQAASYLLARDPEFRTYGRRSMEGTSGRQRVSAATISQYELTTPCDRELWKALAMLIEPIVERITKIAHESRALAETRDLLIPKLMSRDYHARDAEKPNEDIA